MDSAKPEGDNLVDLYGSQIEEQMRIEAQRRIESRHDKDELKRLRGLSLIGLIESNDADTIPALMARLGTVRAALDGHGGGLVLASWEFLDESSSSKALSLVIDLDGACVSCGAAPGTLKGIQDDLLMDPEIDRVRFSSGMLDWFDDIQREFVLKFGEVTFV
jgi:Fe-S cluster biogenesis protein NfuA